MELSRGRRALLRVSERKTIERRNKILEERSWFREERKDEI